MKPTFQRTVLPPSSPLEMEAARPSKTLVFYHLIIWHHNPEDLNLNLHHCKNLKSCLEEMMIFYKNVK
jgi:hypothetical protein